MSDMAGQEVLEQAAAWAAADPDPATRGALAAMLDQGDIGGLRPLFARRVGFGTAGLRATVGPGPAHINQLVVRQSAFGLATHARAALGAALARGVVVGYDGRTDSARFAEDVAGTLAAQGVDVWRFAGPVPTPLVGFAVRQLPAALGVVITASHNPPAYNGLKIYWADGVQLVPPDDQGVAQAILAGVRAHLAPPFVAGGGRARPVDRGIEAAYLSAILPARPPARAPAPALKVAYTPLHGVGRPWVERSLALAGFAPPLVVASQAEPDGAFPTVASPNPEEPESMQQVVALAAATGADLALATDPDADRLAAAAPYEGDFRSLTGDELGALLADWRLADGGEGAVVLSSLVSGPLAGRVARARGALHVVTPTGFRWLAQGMLRARARGLATALAYEEALGFAAGEAVWDKDGVGALLQLVAAASAWRAAGQSVWDRLAALAEQHGLVVTSQRTATGAAAAALDGARLRAQPPRVIAGRPVLAVRDLMCEPWQAPEVEARYPALDVLIYELGARGDGGARDGCSSARVIVRPSGTEPKVKCYYLVTAPPPKAGAFAAKERDARAELARIADCHLRDTRAGGEGVEPSRPAPR